jgi:hypothetical protein
MGRSIEFSGQTFVTVAYGVQWALVLLGVAVLGLGFDSPTEIAAAAAVSLAVGVGFAAWNVRRADEAATTFGRPGDITWDSLDPAQASKERWRAAVRRLPGREPDDEDD